MKFSNYCEEQLNEEYKFNLQHNEVSHSFRSMEDFAAFIDEHLCLAADNGLTGEILLEEFIESYTSWCEENGIEPEFDLHSITDSEFPC